MNNTSKISDIPIRKLLIIEWLMKLHDDVIIGQIESLLTSNGIPQNGRTKKVKRLSQLRGKMTKQSEKEIDDQISALRKEWE